MSTAFPFSADELTLAALNELLHTLHPKSDVTSSGSCSPMSLTGESTSSASLPWSRRDARLAQPTPSPASHARLQLSFGPPDAHASLQAFASPERQAGMAARVASA